MDEPVLDCSPEFVESAIKWFGRRCEAARHAGGISAEAVCNGDVLLPERWVLDEMTDYYLPPDVVLFSTEQEKIKQDKGLLTHGY